MHIHTKKFRVIIYTIRHTFIVYLRLLSLSVDETSSTLNDNIMVLHILTAYTTMLRNLQL
jgi:hypothetical protein